MKVLKGAQMSDNVHIGEYDIGHKASKKEKRKYLFYHHKSHREFIYLTTSPKCLLNSPSTLQAACGKSIPSSLTTVYLVILFHAALDR